MILPRAPPPEQDFQGSRSVPCLPPGGLGATAQPWLHVVPKQSSRALRPEGPLLGPPDHVAPLTPSAGKGTRMP